MRAIWSGSVAFGLVNVPVRLYSATDSHDLPMHQVHDEDGGRIHYERRCERCGKVVPFAHIDKAYDDGTHQVVLDDEDLASLPVEHSREIEVVEFVPDEQVDPMRYERSYFLEPSEQSLKAYVLLRRTLETEERTAVVTVSLRQRTRLAALRVHGETLVLQTLLWDDELRRPEFEVLDRSVKVSSKELELASAVVSSMKSDFAPDDYSDEYEAQLKALVEAKLERGEAEPSPHAATEEEGGEVVDLMEALRRSVDKSRAKRTGGATSKEPTSTKATAAKSAAPKKKATTRKTAAPEDEPSEAAAESSSGSRRGREPRARHG